MLIEKIFIFLFISEISCSPLKNKSKNRIHEVLFSFMGYRKMRLNNKKRKIKEGIVSNKFL